MLSLLKKAEGDGKMIQIDESLRLRVIDKVEPEAVSWYQDLGVQWLVNGIRRPYSEEEVAGMYRWQALNGAAYYIEVFDGEAWRLAGDVGLMPEDFAIVVGPKFQKQGIAKRVVAYFVQLCQRAGRPFIVSEVYPWNQGSQRLFEGAGLKKYQKVTYYSYRSEEAE